MAKLTTDERNNLSDESFALPGRRYPIHNLSHAKAALEDVHRFGSEKEQVLVKAAIHRKFPKLSAFSFKLS